MLFNSAGKLYNDLTTLERFVKFPTHGLSTSSDMKDVVYPEKLQDKIRQVELEIRALGIQYKEQEHRTSLYTYEPCINFKIAVYNHGYLSFFASDKDGVWHVYCDAKNSSYPYEARWSDPKKLEEIKFGKQIKLLTDKVANIIKKINEIQRDIEEYELEVRVQRMDELFAAYI